MYRRGSFIYDFFTEFVPVVIGIVLGGGLVVFALIAALYTALDGPACRSRGQQMGIEVSWGFAAGCMANLKGQWLPWSEIVPVERDGKIVFVPRPHIVVKTDR